MKNLIIFIVSSSYEQMLVLFLKLKIDKFAIGVYFLYMILIIQFHNIAEFKKSLFKKVLRLIIIKLKYSRIILFVFVFV